LPAGGRAVRGAQGGKKPIAKGDTIACLNCRRRFVTSGAGQSLCKICGGRRDDGLAS
jgi:rRNA maturation endonuclease Nob1